MDITDIKRLIQNCLDKLYGTESFLFKHNLSERCITFRFAHCLQKSIGSEYVVDCDYNSHIINGEIRLGKPINNRSGAVTKRFIDVVVHQRGHNGHNLVCLELKKWNNQTRDGMEKDENNLEHLTSDYGYKIGFLLVFGKNRSETKILIFQNGEKISNWTTI